MLLSFFVSNVVFSDKKNINFNYYPYSNGHDTQPHENIKESLTSMHFRQQQVRSTCWYLYRITLAFKLTRKSINTYIFFWRHHWLLIIFITTLCYISHCSMYLSKKFSLSIVIITISCIIKTYICQVCAFFSEIMKTTQTIVSIVDQRK